MKTPSRFPAALALVAMLTQSTGAADLALTMGPAARPLLFPAPVALKLPPAAAAPRRELAPARSHFWQDLAVVARFVWLQLEAPPPAPAATFARRPVHVEALGPALEPPPSRDRMLVVKDAMVVDVAEAVRGLALPSGSVPIYRARVEGRWKQSGTLRYRLVYKDSYGLTWGDKTGFHFFMPGQKAVDVKTDVPEEIYGEYPVYFHGQSVAFDIELENAGGSDLTGLRVESVQELFDRRGPGQRSDSPLVKRVGVLKAGGKRVLHDQFFVSTVRTDGPFSLEQTHLKISSAAGARVDDAHAGIVDPPNL